LLETGAQQPARSIRSQARSRSHAASAPPPATPAAPAPDTEAVLVPLVVLTTWDAPPGETRPAAQPTRSAPSPATSPPAASAASRQFGGRQLPPPSSARQLPQAQSAARGYSSGPVVEAGTFRVENGGSILSAADLDRDVRWINDPGLERREQGTHQKTVEDFLKTLRSRTSAAEKNQPKSPPAPEVAHPQQPDPFDVIADTEELVRGTRLAQPAGSITVPAGTIPAPAPVPAVEDWPRQGERPAAYSSAPRPPPAAPATPATRPWSDFFHFPAGTSFVVDGPLGYDGKGKVLELTPTVLKFEMHMPDYSIFGYQIPKADIVIAATYAQEGPGNSATIESGGQVLQDTNLVIRTRGDRRHIVPSVGIPGVNISEISVARDGADEIDLDITIDGTEWDFDLER
jgi:hypothetical protein